MEDTRRRLYGARMPRKNGEKRLIAKVKELGYRVRKPGNYVKVTHFAHEDTLKEFRAVAERLDFRIQEAITEAMELWLEKHR